MKSALIYGGLAAAQYVVTKALEPDGTIGGQTARSRLPARSVLPAYWVHGKSQRVAGSIVYAETGGEEGGDFRRLRMIYVLSKGSLTRLQFIYVDGLYIPTQRARWDSSLKGPRRTERQGRERDRVVDITPNRPRYVPFTDQSSAPNNATLVPDRSIGEEGNPDNPPVKYTPPLDEPEENWPDRIAVTPFFKGDGTNEIKDITGSQFYESDIPSTNFLNDLSYVLVELYQPAVEGDLDNAVFRRIPDIQFVVSGIQYRIPITIQQYRAAVAVYQNDGVARYREWINESTDGKDNWYLTFADSNPAHFAFWLSQERMEVPIDRVDYNSFARASVISRRPITISGVPSGEQWDSYRRLAVQRNYEVNCVVSSEDDNTAVISELDFSWAGYFLQVGGIWYMKPGELYTYPGGGLPRVRIPPSHVVRSSDIVQRTKIDTVMPLQQRVNAITIGLRQSLPNHWTEEVLPEITDDAAIARDGRKLPADLGLRDYVNNPLALGRLATIALRRSRAAIVYTFRLLPGPDYVNHGIMPTDFVQITHSRSGLENAVLEVTERAINQDATVDVTLRTISTDTFDPTLVIPRSLPLPIQRFPTVQDRLPEVMLFDPVGRERVDAEGTVIKEILITWRDIGRLLEIRALHYTSGASAAIIAGGGFATLVVPESGSYTVTGQFIGDFGARGPVTSAVAIVSDAALTPRLPINPSATSSYVVDTDGQLRANIFVRWRNGQDAESTVVTVTGPNAFRHSQTLRVTRARGEGRARFIVPSTGRYTIQLYHVGAGGLTIQRVRDDFIFGRSRTLPIWFRRPLSTMRVRETITVVVSNQQLISAVGLPPRPIQVAPARFAGGSGSRLDAGSRISFSLRLPSASLRNRIRGVEIRYNRVSLTSSTPPSRLTTEAAWRNLEFAAAYAITQPLVADIPVSLVLTRNGQYNIFTRYTGIGGTRSSILVTGPVFSGVSDPTNRLMTFDYGPEWSGTFFNSGITFDRRALVHAGFAANFSGFSVNRWNGLEGWPFGRVRTTPIGRPQFISDIIDLGENFRWRYTAEVQVSDPFSPPNPFPNRASPRILVTYSTTRAGLATARSLAVPQDGSYSATGAANIAHRYIQIRVQLALNWSSASIERVSVTRWKQA